jgi:hypothetical protein
MPYLGADRAMSCVRIGEEWFRAGNPGAPYLLFSPAQSGSPGSFPRFTDACLRVCDGSRNINGHAPARCGPV